MHYMYHAVPPNMIGRELMPLNELARAAPDAYAAAAAKYHSDAERSLPDRRRLLQKRIAKLGCLWNDVIHSSAVHPQKLAEAWRGAGYRMRRPIRMFEIPLDALDRGNVLVYEFRRRSGVMDENEFVPYAPERYPTYTEVSATAHARFAEMARTPPFWLYSHVPHVLYKGRISVENLRIITVDP